MLDEIQLPFLEEKGHIVSLVGGGGKTTLLHAMAAHGARKGWRVLASTTTHIQRPKEPLLARTNAELAALWTSGNYAVAGAPAPDNKLTQPPQLERWMAQADAVFLEADGAKHLPCKAPAAHEPVLLPQSAGSGRALRSGKAAAGSLLPAGNGLHIAGRSVGDDPDAGIAGEAAGR